MALGFTASSDFDEDDGNAAKLGVMLSLALHDQRLSVQLTCEVLFKFADRSSKLAPDEAADFIAREGMNYVLGYLRGALADLTREVGLSAVMIPSGIPDEGMLADLSKLLHEDA